jgi:hypothetical protein
MAFLHVVGLAKTSGLEFITAFQRLHNRSGFVVVDKILYDRIVLFRPSLYEIVISGPQEIAYVCRVVKHSLREEFIKKDFPI